MWLNQLERTGYQFIFTLCAPSRPKPCAQRNINMTTVLYPVSKWSLEFRGSRDLWVEVIGGQRGDAGIPPSLDYVRLHLRSRLNGILIDEMESESARKCVLEARHVERGTWNIGGFREGRGVLTPPFLPPQKLDGPIFHTLLLFLVFQGYY